MTLTAPPEVPQPSHDELEALIEEARQRARRRRLKQAAAIVGAALIGAAIYGVVTLTGGGSTTSDVPDGFTSVHARGRVQHVSVEETPSRITDIDLATGARRPARLTYEVWYDPRTKLYRVVDRVDGGTTFDVVGHANCTRLSSGRAFCLPPAPFSDLQMAPHWPFDPKHARVVGAGTFAGRRVTWVESLLDGRPIPGNLSERWGLDAKTHQLLVRETGTGRFVQREIFRMRSDLPTRKVTFVVPVGGVPERDFPPVLPRSVDARPATVGSVRGALGPKPLWLGRRYDGHKLRRVQAGTDGMRARTGRRLVPVKFVRFDYGALRLTEYGAARPWWFRSGPDAGRIVLDNYSQAALVRNGLLVVMEWRGDRRSPLDAASALAAARALRPL